MAEYTDVVDEVMALIQTIWGDIDDPNLFTGRAFARTHLENEIISAKTAFPLAALFLGEAVDAPDWAMDGDSWTISGQIVRIDKATGATPLMERLAFDKGKLLVDALRNGTYDTFSVLERPTLNAEVFNPVNVEASPRQSAYHGGVISFSLLSS